MNTRTLARITAATLLALSAGSCAREYANYPPITGDDFAVKNVNSQNMRSAMAAALRWTALRYPPPGNAFAINLPPGVTPATYEAVAQAVGNGAVPLSKENEKSLPIYHITRIWLRGTVARIDVVRPVFEVENKPGGGPVYRGAEIRLSGGWEPWHVTGSSEYEIGVLEPPALHPINQASDVYPTIEPMPAPYGAPINTKPDPAPGS